MLLRFPGGRAITVTPVFKRSVSVSSRLALPPPNKRGKNDWKPALTLSNVSLKRVRDSRSIFRIASSSVVKASNRSLDCLSRYCLRSECSLCSSAAARLTGPSRSIFARSSSIRTCHASSVAPSGRPSKVSASSKPLSLTCSPNPSRRASSSCRLTRASSWICRNSCTCCSCCDRACSRSRKTASRSVIALRASCNRPSTSNLLAKKPSSFFFNSASGSSLLAAICSSSSRRIARCFSWLSRRVTL